jgi:hypothetical protein
VNSTATSGMHTESGHGAIEECGGEKAEEEDDPVARGGGQVRRRDDEAKGHGEGRQAAGTTARWAQRRREGAMLW